MRLLKNRIWERRHKLGLSQDQLADLLNTRQRTIRRWEQGESIPTVDVAFDMVKILKCSIDELFYFEET